MSPTPRLKSSRVARARDGRLTVALLGSGPFVVVALEQCGQRLWLAVFLFALGAVAPLVYMASLVHSSARSNDRNER